MFSVQSVDSIREAPQAADARDVPRCNFAWSLVGVINHCSSMGVSGPARGRAALLCPVVTEHTIEIVMECQVGRHARITCSKQEKKTLGRPYSSVLVPEGGYRKQVMDF